MKAAGFSNVLWPKCFRNQKFIESDKVRHSSLLHLQFIFKRMVSFTRINHDSSENNVNAD